MEQKSSISKTSECKHTVESHPFLATRVKRGINCAGRRSPSMTSSWGRFNALDSEPVLVDLR